MKSELRKRRELPSVRVSDPREFSEMCLDTVDFTAMGEIPRYVLNGEMYVVPQERSNVNQSGLARVCVSQPAQVGEDELVEALDDAELFPETEVWVLDGEETDDKRGERLFSVLSMDW